jgi:hypothetical protein
VQTHAATARAAGRAFGDELDAGLLQGATSFINESTLPRTIPSLASMR